MVRYHLPLDIGVKKIDNMGAVFLQPLTYVNLKCVSSRVLWDAGVVVNLSASCKKSH